MITKINHLFVYGTLLKDSNHEMSKFLASHSHFIDRGYFHGKLFKVSWFPGATLSKHREDKVFGALFKLEDKFETLRALDVYEGLDPNSISLETDLFKRSIVPVYTESGQVIQAWVYLFNQSIDGLKQIVSGGFLKVMD